MIFGFIFAAVAGLLTMLLGLLPTTGCSSMNFESLNLGYVAAYVNLPVITAGFAVMVSFEVVIQGYRVLAWIMRMLPL